MSQYVSCWSVNEVVKANPASQATPTKNSRPVKFRFSETPDLEVYIDLPGNQTTAGAGTLPPKIVVTDQIPDLCIINNKTNSVEIFELTIPQEKRIEDAHGFKTDKYSHFLTDIQGRNVSLYTIEVGSATGYINERNKA